MKTLLGALAGFALIGAIGATQVNAQSVHVRINKGHKSVEVKTGGGRGGENFRKAEKVEKKATGRYVTVEEKVWVEGYYKTEHQDVWVEGHYKTEHQDVWVEGHWDIVKEARTDCHGCVYYVSVKKWHAGHYVCKEVQVWVPGRYECREVQVWVPGYYKCVTKQVWVEDGCGR